LSKKDAPKPRDAAARIEALVAVDVFAILRAPSRLLRQSIIRDNFLLPAAGDR
jgi:hypothetical protein